MTKTSQDWDDEQLPLVYAYQAALKRARGNRRKVDADGQLAVTELFLTVRSKLLKLIAVKSPNRLPRRLSEDEVQEALAEMSLAVLEAAATFDAARCGSFHAWVTGGRGPAREALFEYLATLNGTSNVPRSRRDMARIAQGAVTRLRDALLRDPSAAEIHADCEAYCYSYQLDRFTPAERAMSADEQLALAHARLRKNGMLAALKEIPELLAMSAAPLPADHDDVGWDAVSFRAVPQRPAEPLELSSVQRLMFTGLSERERELLTAASDGDSAELSSAQRATVRVVQGAVAARVQAPHAHYAFFVPGLEAQFEQAGARARRPVHELT